MAHIQASVVITLLIWAAVSVSGTTTELSTTAGDTVNIACLFGEGTVINIYWYYNNGTGRQKLLFLAKGNITLGAEYANRASLQDDNSTLILENITVVDVGTYCCVVDRKGQIPVQNINTKLNVFSLRPDTLPVIPSCTGADESSSCSIHANQSFTLNCTLPNVYPVEDTELIWYHDRKHFPSIPEVTQNDDGTTDIIRHIKIYETGNFTCNATYLSANGRENTAVSVEARIIIIPAIIPPTDEPNTPDKNLTDGPIVGIALSVATVLIVGILLCIYCLKTRSHCCSKRDGQNSKVVQADPGMYTTLL
ncbi:uncharacterized protein LOC105438486 [Strongylocentrotus purpuratus]|uniref:Ig-like domain-containing protein n=1 Tax=Strongylocentrotus purpuratus TaxID=7668 RepID=A0A7M7NCT5_STRPU|nr:uncharacterized protein LOC105438486 [Strongylocentrotus purpuratus]